MLLNDLFLRESALPDEASIQRRFDFMGVDNRRFIYDPVARRFVVGKQLMVGKRFNMDASHAEEWFDATGDNRFFDRCVRGWMGVGGSYRNGIIHFAPPVDYTTDAAFSCIKAFVGCGATAKTKVRGAIPRSMEEVTIGKLYPDLFKSAA